MTCKHFNGTISLTRRRIKKICVSERERETKHISELPAVDIRFLLAFELIS